MDSGLYAAYSGLLARTQALDLAANNLANTGTNGYRAGRESFRGVLSQAVDTSASQVGDAVNNFGTLGGSSLSQIQGHFQTTGNPLDLAIQGQGYFSVQTKNGIRYTRDGEFQVSNTGVLQTSDGNQVLGTDGKPINIPTGNVSVSGDGTISVSTADGNASVGQIAVMDLGQNGAVSAEGSALYKTADGVVAKPAADTTIQEGALESSNEDPIHGSMQLMLIQRQAEMMQRALTVFHNDFDKTASEDLSKV